MTKKDKPTVAVAGFHSCIRAYKMARVLKTLGYRVIWVANIRLPVHVPFHVFDGLVTYQLGQNAGPGLMPTDASTMYDHFKTQIEFIDDQVDIYHWYNEPDWGVQQIREVSEKPIVFDLHDLRSDREFIIYDDEQSAFDLANGILGQGPVYEALAKERRPDLAKQGKIGYIYPCVPKFMYPNLDLIGTNIGAPKLGGLVYEGGLSTGPSGGGELPYRWWLPFMSELAKKHIRVSCQVSSGGNYNQYLANGIRIVPMQPYDVLLQQLVWYDWGLVGNCVKHPAFDAAMPNKLFEYLAAGLPVMVHQSKLVEEFVKEEGIGVVVDSPDDVVKAFPTASKYKENVLKARQKWCLEEQIYRLTNLYDKVLEK